MGKHDELKYAVGGWAKDQGKRPLYEQEMPKWNKIGETDARGRPKRAILDVVYWHEGRQTCVDVSLVDGSEVVGGGNPKYAIARREKKKHVRYPGPDLYPFVIDARGRWGKEALAWAAGMVRNLDAAEREQEIRRLRILVSNCVQTGVSEQIIAAGKTRV